jgi:hypothetical protein
MSAGARRDPAQPMGEDMPTKSKGKTPVKAVKKPISATKPVEMKRAKVDKPTDLKPSEIRKKKEEAAKPKDAPQGGGDGC